MTELIAAGIVAEARALGIELRALDGQIVARPRGVTPPELVEKIRRHKSALLALLASSSTGKPTRQKQSAVDLAIEGLAILARLKSLTLPAGRMPAAREIAERLAAEMEGGEPIDYSRDPTRLTEILRNIEREMVALGARPDPLLADAIERVGEIFPGSQLAEIREKK